MKIKKFLGHKTLGIQTQQLLQEKDELGQIVSRHNMHEKPFHPDALSKTTLKIILIYVYGCEKRKPKHIA